MGGAIMNAEQTETAVMAALARFDVQYKTTGGERISKPGGMGDKPWECFAWRVSFAPFGKPIETFEYFCGTAHVHKSKFRKESMFYAERPKAPDAAGVLHSLLLDAAAGHMSFSDWCADYGYDDDSMKAFATYQACCDIGKRLAKLFTHEQRASLTALVEDL